MNALKQVGKVRTPHKVAPVGTTVEWYTPPAIVQACGGTQGFDLDPCAPASGVMPCRTARKLLTPIQDGLATPWSPQDFVWMNPPYGRGIGEWMRKLAEHPGGGVALVPANMDPRWMHEQVLRHPNTHALFFVRSRLKFYRQDGTQGPAATFGSLLVAYGPRAAKNLEAVSTSRAIDGEFIRLIHPVDFPGTQAANT